jgi:hypothetical protein
MRDLLSVHRTRPRRLGICAWHSITRLGEPRGDYRDNRLRSRHATWKSVSNAVGTDVLVQPGWKYDVAQSSYSGLQRRIVDVPFLSSAVKCVRIRHVEGCADLQPLRQVRVSQKRFAE